MRSTSTIRNGYALPTAISLLLICGSCAYHQYAGDRKPWSAKLEEAQKRQMERAKYYVPGEVLDCDLRQMIDCSGDSLYGQVSGYVIHSYTREPVIGAAVRLEGTTMGALTDTDGHFRILNVKPGQHVLRAQLVGFVPMLVDNITVDVCCETEVRLTMGEAKIELGEIIVW